MEFLICNDLIVDETDLIENKFYELTSVRFNWNEMKNFVNEEKERKVFYFDSELKRRMESDKEIIYAWVDTGYTTNEGETIFISLVNYAGYYSGHFIGTGKYLCNGLCNRSPYMTKKFRTNFQKFMKKYHQIKTTRRLQYDENESSEDTVLYVNRDVSIVENDNSQIEVEDAKCEKQLSAVTEEIYSNLLFPSWKTIEGLDTFIKIIGRRINQLVEKKRTGSFILNKLGSAIVNTGLMDIYGNDILVLYRKHLKLENYVAYKVITGKRDYLDEGFSVEQINDQIKPLSFLDNNEQVFRPTLEEFDVNMRCLNHIVEERKNRFPPKFYNEPTEYVASFIIRALQEGLKIQERDSSYARPIYSDGKVSWLLPLRLGTKITEEPELVMVVRKVADFYEIKTILPYGDEVKDKITAMALYRKLW